MDYMSGFLREGKVLEKETILSRKLDRDLTNLKWIYLRFY